MSEGNVRQFRFRQSEDCDWTGWKTYDSFLPTDGQFEYRTITPPETVKYELRVNGKPVVSGYILMANRLTAEHSFGFQEFTERGTSVQGNIDLVLERLSRS